MKIPNVMQLYQYNTLLSTKHRLGTTQAATEEVVTPLCDNISWIQLLTRKSMGHYFDAPSNIQLSTTCMSKINKEKTVP